MPIDVTIPRLGWNMETGTFVGWLKADGDVVRPGDVVFRLEGEKSTEDVESLDGGVLHILADGPKPGDVVAVGAVIGFLSSPGDETPARSESPAASPRARRLAERLGVDLAQVRGGGRTGRVREQDVATVVTPVAGLIPHTPVRRTTAVRMIESQQLTAPVTLTTVVAATNLANLRGQFKATGGPVPAYTDFLVKLVGFALQQHPVLASRWTDAGLVPATRIDIGIAVDTDAGLLVPVVQDVPSLGLKALAARMRELIDAARSSRLSARDMDGGCFTVTNLGAFGIDAFTPIINHPEAAILGVGRLDRRPAVRGDEIVVREQVTLSLTFDHRVADGAPAARFLQTLARMIENPGPWLST